MKLYKICRVKLESAFNHFDEYKNWLQKKLSTVHEATNGGKKIA